MKLHYSIQGEGPPLIILHGLFGSSDNWRGIGLQLAQDRQIIAVDLRNHGQSPHSSLVSYRSMADDIAELILNLGINKADIVGHSIGGKVAMTLASRYADQVNNLIVVDIAPKSYPDRHSDIFKALLAIDLTAITKRKEADEVLALKIKNSAIRQFLLMNIVRLDGQFKWRLNLPVLSEKYANLLAAVCQNNTLKQRSLFIRGGQSGYIEKEDIKMIQQQFSNATVTTIEGAGHWIHAEVPDLFLTTIQSFLNHD